MKRHSGAPAPKREVRSFVTGSELEIRKTKEGMKLEGYAIRFSQPSQDLGGFIEYVDKGAVTKTLRDNPDVLLLRDHKSELLLARTTAGNLTLKADSNGLRFSATLLDTTTASDAYKDIKAGLLTGMSFGMYVHSDDWKQANGQLIRTLLEIELFEISATSFPAYQSTSVDARSIRAKLTRRDEDDCDEDEQDDDGNCPGDPDYDGDGDEDRDDIDDDVIGDCDCDCEQCSEDRCERCTRDDCNYRACANRGCKAAGEADTLRLRLKLHEMRRAQK